MSQSSSCSEVAEYEPLNCVFVSDDPIYARVAHVLGSLLYSVCGVVPKALEHIYADKGLQPIKLDLEKASDRGWLMTASSVIRVLCSRCESRGSCPWILALSSWSKQ